MGYSAALLKAWSELEQVMQRKPEPVRFLTDEYSVDTEGRRVLSLSCNIPAKEYIAVLILHYLIRKTKGLPAVTGEWISFRHLEGGDGYYSAFKKRVLDPIVRKHGSTPESLFGATEKLKAKRAQIADYSVVLEVFEGVPLLVTLQRGDEEFGPEATISYDRSIRNIFCTEDVVVLTEFVAAQM